MSEPCIGCARDWDGIGIKRREIRQNGELKTFGRFCDDCTEYMNGESTTHPSELRPGVSHYE